MLHLVFVVDWMRIMAGNATGRQPRQDYTNNPQNTGLLVSNFLLITEAFRDTGFCLMPVYRASLY